MIYDDKIKVLMLKGDKGDKGDRGQGSYDDTQVRQLISNETTARANADASLSGRITTNASDITAEQTARSNADSAILALLNNFKHKTYTLSPEIPLQFTGNSVRGLLITSGASLSRESAYIFFSNSSGSFYAKEVVTGTLISVDTTGGGLTVSLNAEYGQPNALLDILVFSSADIA